MPILTICSADITTFESLFSNISRANRLPKRESNLPPSIHSDPNAFSCSPSAPSSEVLFLRDLMPDHLHSISTDFHGTPCASAARIHKTVTHNRNSLYFEDVYSPLIRSNFLDISNNSCFTKILSLYRSAAHHNQSKDPPTRRQSLQSCPNTLCSPLP